MCGDYLERDVYCCGPEGFMTSVREILRSLGYDMERYSQETFAAPAQDVAEFKEFDDLVPSDVAVAEIVFARSGVSVQCTQTDTVLRVAKSAALSIPSGCTFGVCGTCKVRKTAGDVHMVHNGGISEDDIAEGFILACCSTPIGKVEVDA
jgi:stachydrine N-demethylase, reductase component